MFTDARGLSEGEVLETDVCIVGAGAAGITLATELAGGRFRVMIVESGGLSFEHRNQMLQIAENTGRPYFSPEFTRRRQFGGTTTAWFGRCRPLDHCDFEPRAWIPHSGWPFSRSDLDPYYVRAHALCQAGPYDYDPSPEAFKTGMLETRLFRFSPPIDFGKAYQADLERAGNVRVLLHANVTNIALDAQHKRVAYLQASCRGRSSFRIRGGIFILAAGALENTRVLLASRDAYPEGIGNRHGLLGRYFMEHHYVHSAAVTHIPERFPEEYLKLDYEIAQSDLGTHRTLSLPEAVLREQRLLNAGAYLVKRSSHKMDDRFYTKNAADAMKLVEMLKHQERPSRAAAASGLRAFFRDPQVSRVALRALGAAFRKISQYSLRLQMEAVPNPESRVTLSSQNDELGMPRLQVSWRTTQLDVDAYRRFEQLIHAGLTAEGFRLRRFKHELSEDGWPVSMIGGKHHLGTTRMDADPRRGVVDPDCKLHELDNLFVAGGSVFPTAGMANPTLTIVALAVRLADHIKGRLRD